MIEEGANGLRALQGKTFIVGRRPLRVGMADNAEAQFVQPVVRQGFSERSQRERAIVGKGSGVEREIDHQVDFGRRFGFRARVDVDPTIEQTAVDRAFRLGQQSLDDCVRVEAVAMRKVRDGGNAVAICAAARMESFRDMVTIFRW